MKKVREANMKFRTWMSTTLMCLCATLLALTIPLSAQDNPGHPHHKYKLMQVGTFGGPDSDGVVGPAFSYLNNFNGQGATVGEAATNTADPFAPNCWYDCFVAHAFKFENGTTTDLGALPGTNSSASFGINNNGLVVGASENGLIDPSTGYPEYHAVAWRNGVLSDLGTLGGTVSQAFAVNDQGQVVGVAANAIPDQYAYGLGPCTTWFCTGTSVTTQQRAFALYGGELHDLGTLGSGNDAAAYFVNAGGQVAGISYTNATPNSTTGLPTQDPFFWSRSTGMVDVGSLGGTWGIIYGFNQRGQVTGQSNLAGDQIYHPFLWDRGVLTDLGTLGGDSAYANWLNDAGDVVGASDLAGNQVGHGFLWHKGVMSDLGTLPGFEDSFALAINAGGEIVGASCGSAECNGPQSAFLWENGGPMVDLNTLVPPSSLHLRLAYAIADSGEILAYATLPNGDVRVAVLAPDGDCDNDCAERVAASESGPATQAGQATRVTVSNAPISGKGATGRRPSLFGPRPASAATARRNVELVQ